VVTASRCEGSRSASSASAGPVSVIGATRRTYRRGVTPTRIPPGHGPQHESGPRVAIGLAPSGLLGARSRRDTTLAVAPCPDGHTRRHCRFPGGTPGRRSRRWSPAPEPEGPLTDRRGSGPSSGRSRR
jgi:hypothetical protein